MTFQNEKKTFLEKLDKSRKGDIDERCIPIVNIINEKEDYYTTSSCSGRVYLWKTTGTGKKNETEWLKISHGIVNDDFFDIDEGGLIWLRVEPFIMHVACRDLDTANKLLNKARAVYKKSSLLSISNKIILEIRGSEFIEMPLYDDGKLLFNGDLNRLVELVNEKLKRIFNGIESFQRVRNEL